MAKKLVVKQPPEAEVPTEVLADSITQIAAGVRRLRSGRLNESALLLLIQHAAPNPKSGKRLSISTIKAVLSGMESLEAAYLKKPKPPGTSR